MVALVEVVFFVVALVEVVFFVVALVEVVFFVVALVEVVFFVVALVEVVFFVVALVEVVFFVVALVDVVVVALVEGESIVAVSFIEISLGVTLEDVSLFGELSDNNIQPNNPIIDAVNQITIRDAFTFLIITLPFCFISFGCLFQMFYKFFW